MPLRAHVILFSLMLTNALKLKSIKVSTNINNNVKLKIIFRSMFRVINNTVPNMKIICPNNVISRNYACIQGWKFKSAKVKQAYSNDDQTGHTHGVKVSCETDPNCINKNCNTLCGPTQKFEVCGHTTHKIPTGKKGDILGDTDYNNKEKKQYWCEAEEKKEISTEDLKNLNEDDMQLNKKATDYFNSTNEILEKIK